MPPESVLVKKIVSSVKKQYPQAWIFKTVGNPWQMPGIPDLLVCVEGKFFAFEVKAQRPGETSHHALGRATSVQLFQIGLIREAGGFADVVLNENDVINLINKNLEGSKNENTLE